MFFPIAIVLHALVFSCWGRPDGAPQSACYSLTPVHRRATPQRSSPPYSVSVSKNSDRFKVTISSPVGEQFEGFALQARSSRNPEKIIDGRFTTRNDVSRTIDCGRGKQNTLTQVNPNPKSQVVTEWMPNDDVNENIMFRATVLKTFTEFWTEVDSPVVRMRNGDVRHQKQGAVESNNMYDDCFVTKGCFGYPDGCITRQDCEVVLSYRHNFDGIKFQLNGYLDQQQYMAMGLSTDPLMGEDSVTECFRQGSSVVARESWNSGKSNTRTRELPVRYDGDFVDGVTRCSWTARHVFESNRRVYDLANSTYYVLLAKGPMNDGALRYHSGRIASQNAVNFTAFEAIEGEGVSDSIKIHGTFMVTAWVGCVSLAILLARHFKGEWETSTLCGVKIWFAFHRGLVLFGLAFVVVAFIVIFAYKNGWNYATKNPHAILGCIATGLGLFQPIMALFRPAPDHPKRFIFNWLHFTVGNTAHIIAVITIFFAVSLESSGLKDNFYWVMAVFVVVHCIFHFLLQAHTMAAAKKKNNEVKMLEMNTRRGNTNQSNMENKNVSGSVLRILLLGIYIIFLLVILLALYALIGVA